MLIYFQLVGLECILKMDGATVAKESECGSYLENGCVGVGHGKLVNEVECTCYLKLLFRDYLILF